MFEEAIRLSEQAGLSDLFLLDPQSTGELLQHKESQLLPGLVEIADETGKVVGRRVIGGAQLAASLSSTEAIRARAQLRAARDHRARAVAGSAAR